MKPAARSIWSGAIAFGLVNIPVDLLSAVRSRNTAMKLVDRQGHALGRQYRCSHDHKVLGNDDLVRGYETEDGKLVVITDAEFASAAPEMSADITLRHFVDMGQIPSMHFLGSYVLAPAGKSTSAYHLLAAVMTRTRRAGMGQFVMRGHEYLVAILPDHGVLRLATLRHADEIRSPGDVGLPERAKPAATTVNQFIRELQGLKHSSLDAAELEDREAAQLQALAKAKKKDRASVIKRPQREADETGSDETTAEIIDLTEILRRSLSKRVVVTPAGN